MTTNTRVNRGAAVHNAVMVDGKVIGTRCSAESAYGFRASYRPTTDEVTCKRCKKCRTAEEPKEARTLAPGMAQLTKKSDTGLQGRPPGKSTPHYKASGGGIGPGPGDQAPPVLLIR